MKFRADFLSREDKWSARAVQDLINPINFEFMLSLRPANKKGVGEDFDFDTYDTTFHLLPRF